MGGAASREARLNAELYAAARAGEADAIKRCIARGDDVNWQNPAWVRAARARERGGPRARTPHNHDAIVMWGVAL